MSLFSDIEKTIERSFQRWTERAFGPANSDELLLVHRAILEEIETKVQTVARGKRIFPYARLTVTLVASDEDRRTLLQSAFGERLTGDIRDALAGARCEVPRGFAVNVETAESGSLPFTIEYGTSAPAPPAPTTGPARLTIVRGKAQQPDYLLDRPRCNIGRLAELTDSEQRVVRRNDIVFDEGADEANATVSRKHAHIKLEEGVYRICDDGSEYGTRIFRDGRTIDVPEGNRRGERLRAGDEIYLGRACVRFG
ncbi:MAG TPA: FHA domain-containing protein [Bryobacteraceae bacterium]|nr:FHA domain-containing protein [Bryobacteraceae bacterium]